MPPKGTLYYSTTKGPLKYSRTLGHGTYARALLVSTRSKAKNKPSEQFVVIQPRIDIKRANIDRFELNRKNLFFSVLAIAHGLPKPEVEIYEDADGIYTRDL